MRGLVQWRAITRERVCVLHTESKRDPSTSRPPLHEHVMWLQPVDFCTSAKQCGHACVDVIAHSVRAGSSPLSTCRNTSRLPALRSSWSRLWCPSLRRPRFPRCLMTGSESDSPQPGIGQLGCAMPSSICTHIHLPRHPMQKSLWQAGTGRRALREPQMPHSISSGPSFTQAPHVTVCGSSSDALRQHVATRHAEHVLLM